MTKPLCPEHGTKPEKDCCEEERELDPIEKLLEELNITVDDEFWKGWGFP